MVGLHIPELWSSGDDADLRACDVCLAAQDLAGALLSIEGALPSTRGWVNQRISSLAALAHTASVDPAVRLRAVLGAALSVVRPVAAHRESCALSEVLAGQPGQPAVVVAAWLLVARAAGVPARAVSMPGQVLLALGEGTETLVDPGAPEAHLDAYQLMAAYTGHPQGDLPTCTRAQLTDRVLRDQLLCAELVDDDVSRFRSMSFLAHLHPDQPGPQVALGLVAEDIGAVDLAGTIYAEVAARFAHAHEARIAGRRQRWLAQHPRWLQ
jgi:hypothetical protein